MQNLPSEIYQTQQIRAIERAAIEQFNLSEIALMAHAAQASLNVLQAVWPQASNINIFCGPGNNGGDGYYLAALAKAQGLGVTVYSLAPPSQLGGAAKLAYEKAKAQGVNITAFEQAEIKEADLSVDAILGIGLERELTGDFAKAVEWLNESLMPILAIDVPTGLCSDTGAVLGKAVIADVTVTFIGLKCGLVTGAALDYVGELFLADLDLPDELTLATVPYGLRLCYDDLKEELMPRPLYTHKGDNGHVLIVGGDYGMPGAVSLAANAALRAGAGLVSVITHQEHVPAIAGFCPEIMVYGAEKVDWSRLQERADIIVVGPGLGRSDWSEQLFLQAIKTEKPLVIDADGLYFMKKHKVLTASIITPHPGEAAMLLDITSKEVEANRYLAVQQLRKAYPQSFAVLKGAGSLMLDEDNQFHFSSKGNPGMASAGMGDVLTGIVAGLLAQGIEPLFALALAIEIHGLAGDLAAKAGGERGLVASDLFSFIRQLVNPNDENLSY